MRLTYGRWSENFRCEVIFSMVIFEYKINVRWDALIIEKVVKACGQQHEVRWVRWSFRWSELNSDYSLPTYYFLFLIHTYLFLFILITHRFLCFFKKKRKKRKINTMCERQFFWIIEKEKKIYVYLYLVECLIYDRL